MSTGDNQSGLYKLEQALEETGDQEEIKESKVSARRQDTLAALISSDMFSVHMLFAHLNRALVEGRALQVEQLLAGKLCKETVAHIDFYLPQLW